MTNTDENAHTQINQDEYQSRYESLVRRFETAKAHFEKITEQRKDKKARLKMTEAFISKLRQQNDMVTEFDEHLWTTLLDFVTVYTDKDVRFTFKDGTEIQV